MRGEEIVARRDGSGHVDGGGDVATCRCESAPVRFAFTSAEWDADGEVQMVAPRVELLGVPIVWLPWMWLRPSDRLGLLMPEVALRGDDGLLVGSGVHVPLSDGYAADVRAAGYVEGGAELSAQVEAPTSTTRVVWDHRRSTRTVVRSTGQLDGVGEGAGDPGPGLAPGTLAWSADAIRGERAQRGTVDLFEATLPHDHVRVEATTATDELGAMAGASLRGRAARGLGDVWLGPRVDLGVGSSLGGRTVWGASSHSGVLMSDGAQHLPYAVGRLEGETTVLAGPLALRIDSRDRIRAVRPASGPSRADGVASIGLTASLPLVRSFDRRLVHWVVPELVARSALTAAEGDALGGFTRADAGSTWVAGAGTSTSIGTYGSESLRVSLRGGALGHEEGARPAGHGRVAMEAGWLGLDWTGGVERHEGGGWGAEHWIRGRLGDRDGLALRGGTASRVGRSPREARWFADDSALPGDELTAIRASGWTGGAQLDVPWTASLTTSSRLDGRLDQPRLLALGSAVAYRHPCHCIRVGGSAAHRLGRGGIDLTLLVDILP